MKNNVKNFRILVMAWAAGVWQNAHITRIVPNRARIRRNPNRMIIIAASLNGSPVKFGEQHHPRRYAIPTVTQLVTGLPGRTPPR